MVETMHRDLRHYIRVYDADLHPDLCRKLIDSFGSLQRFQQQNGRDVRPGLEQSEWTELNITRLSDAGFLKLFESLTDRGLARYNADVGLPIAIPNSRTIADLVMKRYRQGSADQFQLHFDAIHHMANRYLVFLWYLNDVAAGGETRFPQLDLTVSARQGRLLVFPPYWMYQHEGLPAHSGDKYILSTYLLFGPQPSTQVLKPDSASAPDTVSE